MSERERKPWELEPFRAEVSEIYPGVPITAGQKERLRLALLTETCRIFEEVRIRRSGDGDGIRLWKLEKAVARIGVAMWLGGSLLALGIGALAVYVMVRI